MSEVPPLVAIVGRQNVGKSSLFNRLCKRRIAIVDKKPGTTLDRVEQTVEWSRRTFRLVDTGGLGFGSDEVYGDSIDRQVEFALERAVAIIFVCDVVTGITKTEQEIAKRLRRLKRPVFVAVNKVDHSKRDPEVGEFQRLGLGPPFAISVIGNRGIQELIESLLDRIPETESSDTGDIRISVVGKPNVGKSTLVNALCGQDRVIVSERPGTTRDAIDIEMTRGDDRIVLVDTAGLRRRQKVRDSVEFFSQARARAAIRRSDGILFLLEAVRELSAQEKKLGDLIQGSGKPCVIALNKWDLVPEDRKDPKLFFKYLEDAFPVLSFAPVKLMSARTGLEVWESMDALLELVRISRSRVGTGELNRALRFALQGAPLPVKGLREGKLLYATQTGTAPPTLVIFVKNRDVFPQSYVRHIENSMRRVLPYSEIPIKIVLREKRGKARNTTGETEGRSGD